MILINLVNFTNIIYFSEKYWPEFTPEDLHAAIESYKTRNRRFGGRSEKGEAT